MAVKYSAIGVHYLVGTYFSLVFQDLVNIEMFLTAKEVEESLERQETATCLAWCHDNKSRLRKMKVVPFQQFIYQDQCYSCFCSYPVSFVKKLRCLWPDLTGICLILWQSCLEFSLRIQEFIELIRQNKRMDAVRYVA